jgi:F-type H+-transporting ATPase subunit c
MDSMTLIAMASIITAGLTTGFGCMGPALGEGRAVATALSSLAQQPDASATITRTLFVGLAMIDFRQSILESRHRPSGGKVNRC